MQQVVVGRQQGQWLRVVAAGLEFYVRPEKCCNGYVRLLVECPDDFEVHRWDDDPSKPARMASKDDHGPPPPGRPVPCKPFVPE